MHRTIRAALAAAVLTVLLPAAADAEDVYVLEKDKAKMTEGKPEGWDFSLSLGASLNFTDNRNVVGQTTGSTFTFGFLLNGGAGLYTLHHEWRNSLGLALAFSRSPVYKQFVKSDDKLALESIYLWKPIEWVGPYARFTLDTAMLFGHYIHPGDLATEFWDATAGERLKLGTKLEITDPFQPLKLGESVGAFLRPVNRPDVTFEGRLGFGARQTFADGQYVLADDAATTDRIEFARLRTFHVAGAEATALVHGELYEKKLSYKAEADVLFPFVNDDARNRGVIDLTEVAFLAQLSFKLVSWASLDYVFKTIRDPQVVSDWQIQNNLLLSFTYTLVE